MIIVQTLCFLLNKKDEGLDLANFLFIIVILYDYMKVHVSKPITKRQIRGITLVRNGRGFSKSELKEVGIINISIGKEQGHTN